MGTYWKSFGDDFTIANHSSNHELGGRDELSVDGLEGYLAWPQGGGTPGVHALTGSQHSGVSVLDSYLSELPQHALTGEYHTGLDFLDGYLTDADIAHFLTYDDVDGYALRVLLDDYAVLADFLDHSARHESGGADEISVAGLSGVLADAQTPIVHALTGQYHTGLDFLDGYLIDEDIAHFLTYDDVDGYALRVLLDDYAVLADFLDHSARHENGGADEISVAGLSGSLADPQTPITHALTGEYHTGLDFLDGYLIDEDIAHFLTYDDVDGYATKQFVADGYVDTATFEDHSARHENGGADEISVEGLSGSLADPQTPITHALTGEYHTGLSFLDGYLVQSDLAFADAYALQTDFADHSTRHESGGADEISVAGLEGYLATLQDAYSIQGRYVTAAAPSDDDVLVWDAAAQAWVPEAQTGGVTLAQAYAIASLRI